VKKDVLFEIGTEEQSGSTNSPEALDYTLNAVQQFCNRFGDRDIFIARELTKVFEELLRMKISEAIRHFTSIPPRGEFILVVRGEKS